MLSIHDINGMCPKDGTKIYDISHIIQKFSNIDDYEQLPSQLVVHNDTLGAFAFNAQLNNDVLKLFATI